MRREEDLWKTDDPVFSVRGRRSAPLVIVADPAVRRFDGRLLLLVLLSTAAWATLFMLWLPTGPLPTSGFDPASIERADEPWWMPVLAGAVLLMAGSSWMVSTHARELFRETSIGFRLCLVAAGTGLLLGGAAHLPAAVTPEEPGVTPWMFTLAGLVIAAVSAVLVPARFRRIRNHAALITRLEARGTRHLGVIRSVDSRSGTELGRPRFRRVVIDYTDETGTHTLLAAMVALPTRVPLPGSPVLVLSGTAAETHVTVDPDRPMTFDPDDDRYREASDGGGS